MKTSILLLLLSLNSFSQTKDIHPDDRILNIYAKNQCPIIIGKFDNCKVLSYKAKTPEEEVKELPQDIKEMLQATIQKETESLSIIALKDQLEYAEISFDESEDFEDKEIRQKYDLLLTNYSVSKEEKKFLEFMNDKESMVMTQEQYESRISHMEHQLNTYILDGNVIYETMNEKMEISDNPRFDPTGISKCTDNVLSFETNAASIKMTFALDENRNLIHTVDGELAPGLSIKTKLVCSRVKEEEKEESK